MKNINLILRRTHLYLGMLLIPWLFIYAFSTWMLNHGPFFRQFRPGPDAWDRLWEKEYSTELPATQAELRQWAGARLEEHGFSADPFGVRRTPDGPVINAPRFLRPIRLTYRVQEGKLVAEARQPSWMETFLRLHFRAGYGQGGVWQKIWGFIVDLVCLSFLVWVATGLYLWWKIPPTRAWGWIALIAGWASFLGMLWAL